MKKTKRIISTILVVLMCLTSAPLNGFMEIKWKGFDFPKFDFSEIFTTEAKAARDGDYSYEVSFGEATITDVRNSLYGEKTIPSTLGGYPVTKIGEHAFENCDKLSCITIPDSVTSIGKYAFKDCDILKIIKIPDSVTSIEDYVFFACESINNITIPDSVTSIGDFAFFGCDSLTSITIPDSVTSIGVRAFSYCARLGRVTIPDSVTSIGDRAFNECGILKSITVSENNLHYSSDKSGVLFNKDITKLIQYTTGSSVTTYNIPDSVTDIEAYAFSECDSLTSMTIPDSVTSIGAYAFSNCGSLTSITIPDSVTSIGDGTFYFCGRLTSMTIPDSMTSIGNSAFSGCNSLTSITIPDSVTSIGDSALSGCDSLKIIIIPDSVTSIGDNAFRFCDISDVYYTGSKSKWANIKIGIYNDPLLNARIHFHSDEYSIAIFSSEKSLSVEKGASFDLSFGLLDNNALLVDETWKKMSLVVSNPDIISISSYKRTEYGYSITVTGKKSGVSNLTITDAESGVYTIVEITVRDKYAKTYSYAIEDVKVFYPANKYENHLATNLYDINGIYVNNYQCTKIGNKYKVSFNAYNSKYYTGAVDIYDKYGNWQECREIEKFSSISSIWDTGEQIFYLISNVVKILPGGEKSNLLTYEQDSFAKESKIDFEVPDGGYFKISNNMAQSPGTFFFNSSELLFDATLDFLDLAVNGIDSGDFAKLLLSDIQKDPALRKAFFETFKDVSTDKLSNFGKKIFSGRIQDGCAELTNYFEDMLKISNIKWKDAFQTVTGVGESLLTKLSGPAGMGLRVCFAISKGTNKLLQVNQFAASLDEPYVTVYSKIDDSNINPQGISVNTNGNVDKEAVLQVFRVSNTSAIEVSLDTKDPFVHCEVYNICFVKDDEAVQPNGKVKVMIPIPKGMNGDTCNVYRQESDGNWTTLTAKKEGNYLVFETNHFSLYAVVGSTKGLSVKTKPEKTQYQSNDILDTSGLVLDFNGTKITSGFLCSPSVLSGTGNQTITVQYGNATTTFTVKVTQKGSVLNIGDIDSNGKITAADARLVLRASVGLEKFTPGQTTAGDIDKNKKITAADARLILRASVGLENPKQWLK